MVPTQNELDSILTKGQVYKLEQMQNAGWAIPIDAQAKLNRVKSLASMKGEPMEDMEDPGLYAIPFNEAVKLMKEGKKLRSWDMAPGHYMVVQDWDGKKVLLHVMTEPLPYHLQRARWRVIE